MLALLHGVFSLQSYKVNTTRIQISRRQPAYPCRPEFISKTTKGSAVPTDAANIPNDEPYFYNRLINKRIAIFQVLMESILLTIYILFLWRNIRKI